MGSFKINVSIHWRRLLRSVCVRKREREREEISAHAYIFNRYVKYSVAKCILRPYTHTERDNNIDIGTIFSVFGS